MEQFVYLVEDDVSIRELILYALKTAGFKGEGFETRTELFAAVAKQSPALVLLDIMLPKDNGVDILKEIRRREDTSALPVIMLTAKGSELDKVSALDAGADDYITKPFGVLELLSRVKALLRRTNIAAAELPQEEIIEASGIEMNISRRTVIANGEEIALTFKEFELLAYLMRNKGLVLSRDRILQTVWDYSFEGESRTVDMHVKLLRQKLPGQGEVIQTVRGVGYRFV